MSGLRVRLGRGNQRTLALLVISVVAVPSACSSTPEASSGPTKTATSSSAPTPSFADPVSSSGGKDPEALAIADVNGDGYADLVTANSYGDDVSIYLGGGDGSFEAPMDFPVGTAPASVAVGDLDGDGRLDVVTTNGGLAEGESEEIRGSDDLSVLLGRGDGTFADHADYGAGDVPMGVAIVDVNTDEVPDLLSVDRHESTVAVLLGNGDGSFQPFAEMAIPDLALARRLTVADVTGDGLEDVLVPDELRGSVWVVPATADHSFGAPQEYPTGGIEPVAIAVGDFDSDGRVDLVTANGYPAYDVSVLLASDSGFGEPTTFGTGFAPHSVVAMDLNDDGVLDLATGNVGDATVSILLGEGDGTFASAVGVPTGSDTGNNTIGVADLNGDGKPDLVTTNYKPSSLVTVLLQT